MQASDASGLTPEPPVWIWILRQGHGQWCPGTVQMGDRWGRDSECNCQIRVPLPPAQALARSELYGNQYHTSQISGAARTKAQGKRSTPVRSPVVAYRGGSVDSSARPVTPIILSHTTQLNYEAAPHSRWPILDACIQGLEDPGSLYMIQEIDGLDLDSESAGLLLKSVRGYAIYSLDPGGYVTSWNRSSIQSRVIRRRGSRKTCLHVL